MTRGKRIITWIQLPSAQYTEHFSVFRLIVLVLCPKNLLFWFSLIYSRNRQLFSAKNSEKSTVRSLLSTRQQTANDFLNINHTLRNVFIWKQILMKMKWICSVTKNNEMENSITEDELLTGVKIYPWWYNKHLITCKKIKDHSCVCVFPMQHKGVSWTEERTKVRCYTVCPCLLRNGQKGRFLSFDSVCARVCVYACVCLWQEEVL